MSSQYTKGKTNKRLKAVISAMEKCQKFFYMRGATAEAKACMSVMDGASKLVKKIKGVY
tara:strand:- start:1044 stop:1220 length:177 start_codon:yes stop_codon:yes gene_type:complete